MAGVEWTLLRIDQGVSHSSENNLVGRTPVQKKVANAYCIVFMGVSDQGPISDTYCVSHPSLLILLIRDPV